MTVAELKVSVNDFSLVIGAAKQSKSSIKSMMEASAAKSQTRQTTASSAHQASVESKPSSTSSKTDESSLQLEVAKLQQREKEVIAHEQAHKAVGGRYAGAASYSYTQGPDGKNYISGGEVSIDTSEENKPEKTIPKMQQVRAAALAPVQPSPQDMTVAGSASQKEAAARAELMKQLTAQQSSPPKTTQNPSEGEKPADQTNAQANQASQPQAASLQPADTTAPAPSSQDDSNAPQASGAQYASSIEARYTSPAGYSSAGSLVSVFA